VAFLYNKNTQRPHPPHTRTVHNQFGSQLEEFQFDQELHRLEGPLDHSLFQQIDFGEALRFLYVSLKVTRIEDPDTPGLVDPRRPTIHFRGTSNLRAPNESSVYGTVSVTPEGDIRWFMVTILFLFLFPIIL
jgi:hypothetical protein